MAIDGPVSALLEAEVRSNVRRSSLVVWLDMRSEFKGFFEALEAAAKAGDIPYRVLVWRGSHLEFMEEVRNLNSGATRPHAVLYLPGFNEQNIRTTPLYGFYEAGVRMKKNLGNFIADVAGGKVSLEQVDAFRRQPGMTVESADVWLARLLAEAGGGLASQLQLMQVQAVVDDLLEQGPVAARLGAGNPEDIRAIWKQLETWLGMAPTWRAELLPAGATSTEDMAFVAASWALCVEYVFDLQRKPTLASLQAARGLPASIMNECRRLASHLRERHVAFYQRTANETEMRLAEEIEAARAEDLGKIDTFRFEEDKVLKAAVVALAEGHWDQPAAWAATRLDSQGRVTSFWLRVDPTRQSAWQLVRDAARLGAAMAMSWSRPGRVGGLDEAVATYATKGAPVDEAHRHLEQRRVALLYPPMPEFEAMRGLLDGMRRRWRQWADAWARDFNDICRTHGFLPSAGLQQRGVFDEVVKPLLGDGVVTAYFVVDALRYEMGVELWRHLKDTPAAQVQLQARLAELPTVTEVGMNVLAPVVRDGKLAPVLGGPEGPVVGFESGEIRVSDPETRRRAMVARAGGRTCPWLTLEEAVSVDADTLKRKVAGARLVVVHSLEIDLAGERGAGPSVFESVLQKLLMAWNLLRDAGVRRFVVTSDHGFLLLDDAVETAVSHGRRIDPKRRHVFSTVAADHAGEVRVPLAELGYEGAAGHLMFPTTTAVFDTGRRAMSFVHGGNSPQERVIPVLTLVHRAPAGASAGAYRVTAGAREGVAGMHCVAGTVTSVAQGALDFGGVREVGLALRVVDGDGVQVELCQVRGKKARLDGATIVVTVGEDFEVFFRLSGATQTRVAIELAQAGGGEKVVAGLVSERFAVTAVTSAAGMSGNVAPAPVVTVAAPVVRSRWQDQIMMKEVRQIFEHLEAHGTITEDECTQILGGPRPYRQFAVNFEAYVKLLPFGVRIETPNGQKLYVKEGGAK